MNLRARFGPLLHADHHYMTLSAVEQLPASVRAHLGTDLGLLLRFLCEVPDVNWPIYGTLGCWEITSTFSYDMRRELKASLFTGHNPVAGTGQSYPHDRDGVLRAAPPLLRQSVQCLTDGRRRHGLGFLGAVCHYVQDMVTYPEQQTLHRRPMRDFQHLHIRGYAPQRLFSDPAAIETALEARLAGHVDEAMKRCASAIRTMLRSGDVSNRNALYEQTDRLGAQLTADLLLTVLSFYRPAPAQPLDVSDDFSHTDEEGLPDGYFVDREPCPVFQGYAATEGQLPRGFDLRKTPGLQLRLAASGDAEIRWRRSLVEALPVDPGRSYELGYEMLTLDSGGTKGVRLHWLDDRWEPVGTLELPCPDGNGWHHEASTFSPPREACLARMEFYSRQDPGSALLDNWQLRDTAALRPAAPACVSDEIRLHLAPGSGYTLRDVSAFAVQNEPITAVRGGMPGDLSDGDEFRFGGANDFIEIAFHPVYQPLWPDGPVVISFDFLPHSVERGELIMSANTQSTPRQGWRLTLEDGHVTLYLYGREQCFHIAAGEQPVAAESWQHVRCRIDPLNRFRLDVGGTAVEGQAPFAREYSRKGHYIGADHGICNFYHGRLRNVVISTECE